MKPDFFPARFDGIDSLVLSILILTSVFRAGAHEEGGFGHRLGPENTNSPAATPAANVRLVSQIDPFPGNNHYTDVWGEGDYAYIGSLEHEDIAIIDISDAAAPKLAGTYHGTTNGWTADLLVKDGIAYLASDGPTTNKPSGVYIIDVTNPANPVLLSQITAAEDGYDKVHNLFVDGEFLYLADARTPVVKVFNVRTASAPVFVRDIRTTDTLLIHDMTVIKNRLYTSGWGGNTDIYDVTDIATRAPQRLGSIFSGPSSHSSWVNSDETILATCSETDEPRELRIYNISDPKRPRLLKRIDSRAIGLDPMIMPHNPVIMGDLLFVSWYHAGLQVFNIRDPANPLLVGAFDTFPGDSTVPGGIPYRNIRHDGCWGVYPLLGLGKVLLSDMDGGLFIVDATRLGGPDSDGDRIPDGWEDQHSLSAANSDDALFDSDGDGINNLHEFLAGTNPKQADESARITRIESSGRNNSVSFSAREGRLYSLERNNSLGKTGWILVRDEIQCTNGVATAIHTNGPLTRQFYRVLVRP